jgi:hypothetical protein
MNHVVSRIIRPGDNTHRAEDLPVRPDPTQSKAIETLPEEWIREYDYHTPALVAKEKYENDPVWRQRVDLLTEQRSKGNANS